MDRPLKSSRAPAKLPCGKRNVTVSDLSQKTKAIGRPSEAPVRTYTSRASAPSGASTSAGSSTLAWRTSKATKRSISAA